MKPLPDSSRFPRPARIAAAISLAILALLILLPLLQVVSEIFWVDGEFSFVNLKAVLLDGRQLHLLGNSLFISFGSAGLALLWGIPFALFVTRTQLPGRRIFQAAGVLPLLIPPLIAAIAWSGWLKIQGPLWIALLFSFSYFPFVWILVARTLERMDRRAEEAARLAGGWHAAARATLPYVMPSALIGALLVVTFTLADFSLPDYLSAIGPKFNVHAEEIFLRWGQENRVGEALALSIPPILLIGLALFSIGKLRRRLPPPVGPRFLTPERRSLGAFRWLAILFIVTLLVAAAGIPLLRLAIEAGGPASYMQAIGAAHKDLGNSLVLSSAAALLAVAIQIFPALLASRSRQGSPLEFAMLLPLALPALVLSIGMIRLWNRPGPVLDWGAWIYGTKAVVILLFLARFSVFSFFAANEGFRAIGPSLEEAAAVSGIPWWARFRGILLPMAAPALLSGGLLVYLFSMREIDSIALIPSANSTVMFRIYNYIHFGRDSLLAALCLTTVFCAGFPLLVSTWLSKDREP